MNAKQRRELAEEILGCVDREMVYGAYAREPLLERIEQAIRQRVVEAPPKPRRGDLVPVPVEPHALAGCTVHLDLDAFHRVGQGE